MLMSTCGFNSSPSCALSGIVNSDKDVDPEVLAFNSCFSHSHPTLPGCSPSEPSMNISFTTIHLKSRLSRSSLHAVNIHHSGLCASLLFNFPTLVSRLIDELEFGRNCFSVLDRAKAELFSNLV